MKRNQVLVLAAALCVAATAEAGGWRLSVGPAYRARMKTEMRGAPTVADTTETTKTDRYRDMENGNWGGAYAGDSEARPDPADDGLGTFVPVGAELWGISATYSETTVAYDGNGSAIDATDRPSALGLKARVGYDFYESDTLAVGLDLRFAGYWNMKASASGRIAGSRATTKEMKDWWLFEGGPYDMTTPPAFADGWQPTLDPGSRKEVSSVVGATTAGRTVRARIRADLYQIGLGPTVTWRAFPWLDAYAGAAALCNLTSLDFDAGASRTSETKCGIGFAGEVGLMARLTDSLGLYAEVGYERVDGFDAAADGIAADVDFSSLVVSAGLTYRF